MAQDNRAARCDRDARDFSLAFFSSLVVVNQLNVKDTSAFKAKRNAPIGTRRHGPHTFQIAFERVEPIPWKIQGLRRRRRIENREDAFDRVHHIGPYAAPVASLIEPLQAAVFESSPTIKSSCSTESSTPSSAIACSRPAIA